MAIDDNIPIRQVVKQTELPYPTLRRYVNKIKNGEETSFSPKYQHRQIFSKFQEEELCKYLITCSEMCFGLGTSNCRKLAYQLAKKNVLVYPKTWDENQMAGFDWFMGFRDRNPSLSLRKPENCSLSRAISFNHFNVSIFSKI